MPLGSFSLRFTCSASSSLFPFMSNGRVKELITQARYDGTEKMRKWSENFFSVVYIFGAHKRLIVLPSKAGRNSSFCVGEFLSGFGSICRSNGVESTSQTSIKSKHKLFNFRSLRMLSKHHPSLDSPKGRRNFGELKTLSE